MCVCDCDGVCVTVMVCVCDGVHFVCVMVCVVCENVWIPSLLFSQ